MQDWVGESEQLPGTMEMVAEEEEMNGNWAFSASDHLCNCHHEPLHDP